MHAIKPPALVVLQYAPSLDLYAHQLSVFSPWPPWPPVTLPADCASPLSSHPPGRGSSVVGARLVALVHSPAWHCALGLHPIAAASVVH